jgi:predicted nuclease of predicted toxin-antitoxin system
VWRHAQDAGFTIVSKDDDFRQRAFLRGAPPKVIWVNVGNCTTAEVDAILRARHGDVLAFEADPTAALLLLARRA